jgi:transposase
MIPAGTKVYFAVQPADLRRSFDGLAALAQSQLERDPAQGGLFVFTNRRATQVRVLFRDPQGWCLLSKRLDQGRFRRPSVEGGQLVWETEAPRLLAFLQEIDLAHRTHAVRRRVSASLRIVRADTQ